MGGVLSTCRGKLPKLLHYFQHQELPQEAAALLTGAAGAADRSPLLCRSGDSEVLPVGESSPDGGDRLRSTRGAAEKRPSTLSGNLGFNRKPGREKAQFRECWSQASQGAVSSHL